MDMTAFYQDHGHEVAEKILQNAPKDAQLFVYAYMAKSIDYLKRENEELFVWNHGNWRLVNPLVVHSFLDILCELSELKAVVYETSH